MSILRAGVARRLVLWTLCVCFAAPLRMQAGESPVVAATRPLMLHTGQRYSIPEGSPLRERITVATVQDEAMPERIPIQAVVEADPGRSASILAPLTGRVQRLPVHLGDRVVQGQLVAEITAPDLTQAIADRDKAQEALGLASKLRERARAVLQAGGNAVKDLEQADSTVAQAEVEQQRARARLRALGVDPDLRPGEPLVRLQAPIAGVVTAVGSVAGGVIADPAVPLLTISNLDQVWVTAQVPEPLLAAVHPGQAAELQFAAFPGEVLHGRVATLAPTLDADTRRTRARIPLANPDGRFRPNMFATATLVIPRGRTVRVPQTALMMINDSVTVLVEVAAWTFERRSVELGSEDAQGVRVLSGLQRGQRVIVRGGVLLND